MKNRFSSSKTFLNLRNKAGELFKEKGKEIQDIDEFDLSRFVHERDAYHTGPEVQNEEPGRAKAEPEALRNEFLDLLESGPVAYLTLNQQGIIEKANQAACRMFKSAENFFLGSSFLSWIHRDDLHVCYSLIKQLASNRKAGPVELRLRGDESPLYVHVEAVTNVDEEVGLKWRFAFVDITERKRTEEALLESLEWLRLTQAAGGVGSFDWDLTGQEARCSEEYFRVMGRTVPNDGKVSYDKWKSWIYPDDSDRILTEIQAALDGSGKASGEYRVISEDGGIRWIYYRGETVSNAAGRPLRMLGTVQDITERKLIETTLQESEERFRIMADGLPLIVWVHDAQGNQQFVNRTFCEFFGVTIEEMRGNLWKMLLHPDDADDYTNKFFACLRDKRPFHAQVRVRRVDGQWRWIESWARPRESQTGKFLGFVGASADITDRKQMEDDLNHLNQTLEDQVEQRTADLGKRTSLLARLASELTMAEQRERRRISEILHDHLQQLMVAAKMNQELLVDRIERTLKPVAENVLDLIKRSIRESRSLSVELSPPVLRSGDLSASLEWLARWMHENQRFEVMLRIEAEVVLDREDLTVLLFQSIRELLLNALKHSGETSADITMKKKDGELHIIVSDRGVGFDVKTVWQDSINSNKFGLFSIRERLVYLGARLDIESTPSAGTTISMTVPLDEKTATEEMQTVLKRDPLENAVSAQSDTDKIRVLIVDDHSVVRRGLSTFLSLEPDIQIIGEATDGEKAVHLTREIVPDVILMDINMPNMDGLQATRIIHEEYPEIRIIGLSMYEAKDRADEMISAGASAYRSKSDNMDLLLSAIRYKAD